MHILEIKDLDFTYQHSSQPALKKINFSIEENSFTILMGKSGAGKSTLAKCLTGVIPQFQKGNYSGKVTIYPVRKPYPSKLSNGVYSKEAKNTPVHEIAQEIGLLLYFLFLKIF